MENTEDCLQPEFQTISGQDSDNSPSTASKSVSTTKTHEELLKEGDEILRKLEEVRRTKAYEMMKYETIARMNAASVSAYLRQERLKPTAVKPSRMDQILQKQNEQKRNQAATIIQHFFRKCVRQKQIDRTLYAWRWVPFDKRLKYIEAVAERMSTGSVPRKVDLSIIKSRLEQRKKMMPNEVAKFVRREELVKIIDRDLRLLNGITNINDLMEAHQSSFSTRETVDIK